MPVMPLSVFRTSFRQMMYRDQFARAQSRDVVSQYSFGRQPDTFGGSKSCWPMSSIHHCGFASSAVMSDRPHARDDPLDGRAHEPLLRRGREELRVVEDRAHERRAIERSAARNVVREAS